MLVMEAKTYEFSHPDGGRFQFWSDDHEVVVETGSPYTTDDPVEQELLEACEFVGCTGSVEVEPVEPEADEAEPEESSADVDHEADEAEDE